MRADRSKTVFMRGCGDLGTGVALALVAAGYRVLVIERPRPTTLRRQVALSTAAIEGRVTVGGVEAVHAETLDAIDEALAAGQVPVWTRGEAALGGRYRPDAIVDARLRGLAEPSLDKAEAPVVIALGPGYVAGRHCHYVIETNRGPSLGAVLERGQAEPHTGVPGTVAGEAARRILRSPVAGVFTGIRGLGELVEAGEVVGTVDGVPVRARLSGMIRGLLLDGHAVPAGKKVGDVDPRGADAPLSEPSDKSAAIGAGVLEALRRGEGGGRAGA
ncbi:MAG: molybdenum hydroxylase [Proteobacteria bacterium]|nr:MAG: molybdenum hydroxylase [Pseudomonadota bacterium]